MLEMTAVAARLLRAPSGRNGTPLLTAVALPRAFLLAPQHDGIVLPPVTVRLHVDQLSGNASLVSAGRGTLQAASKADSREDSTHLTATACRTCQTRPIWPEASGPAASPPAAELTFPHLMGMRLVHEAVAAQPPASWAVIGTSNCEPDVAAPADCCLHLGAVSRSRSAACSLSIPAGAASHTGSHAEPEHASAHAAAGEQGPLAAAQSVTDHRLSGRTAHSSTATQGLLCKPMSSSAIVAPGAFTLQGATNEAQAGGPSQMVYEVVHCVNAPAIQERHPPAQVAGFALAVRLQRGQHRRDGLLRSMAACLASAQQAHRSASQLALRTAGALRHDGSICPHGPASTMQAVHGAAAWSLARCLEAEGSGELLCNGFDGDLARAGAASGPELLLQEQVRSGSLEQLGGGLNERTSLSAGAACRCRLSSAAIQHQSRQQRWPVASPG